MATDREVLKEFLVSLGFQLDEHGLKKFVGATTGASSAVFKIGSALVSASAAVEAFTLTIGRGLEKLFYAAQRTGTTMANLDAIEKAAQRVGLETGEMTSAMQGFAQALRLQPGLTQVLRGFGIDTAHLDKTQQFIELLERLAKTRREGPAGEAVAAQFGQMFGISPDLLVQLTNNLPRLRAEFAAQLAQQKQAGEQLDQMGPDMVELINNTREVGRQFTSLARQLAREFAPGLNRFMKETAIPFLRWLIGVNKAIHPVAKALSAIAHPFHSIAAFGETTGNAIRRLLGLPEIHTVAGGVPAASPTIDTLLSSYASAFGIPPAVARALMKQESGGNPNAISKRGAQGLMQLMPDIQTAYGVQDPFDPEQNIRGSMAMMQDLLKEFGGDMAKALAAYNWGAGNMEHLLASPQGANWRNFVPDETKRYLDAVLSSPGVAIGGGAQGNRGGVTQNNITTIHVTGTDAKSTGKAVADQQGRVLGDAVRNLKSAFVPGG